MSPLKMNTMPTTRKSTVMILVLRTRHSGVGGGLKFGLRSRRRVVHALYRSENEFAHMIMTIPATAKAKATNKSAFIHSPMGYGCLKIVSYVSLLPLRAINS